MKRFLSINYTMKNSNLPGAIEKAMTSVHHAQLHTVREPRRHDNAPQVAGKPVLNKS
jgi:hypothetical protein